MYEFAWPWMFLLLPLPWLVRKLMPSVEPAGSALRVSFLDELQSLSKTPSKQRIPALRAWTYAVIWALLVTAAARPQWVGEAQALPTQGRDLMIAADVSGSMETVDMRLQGQPVTRLDVIKALIGDFIEGREGDRLGLILFGSRAYLQAPLTFDRATVRAWLDEAQIGIAGPNTAIGDAIGLAIKRLRDRPAQSRILVLITDGANTDGQVDPMEAAQRAAENGVRIYTIGIGGDPGLSDLSSLLSSTGSGKTDLDEGALRKIAEITGGRYFRARSAQELKEVDSALDELEPIEQKALSTRPRIALHVWPLGAALGLSLLAVLLVVKRRHLNLQRPT